MVFLKCTLEKGLGCSQHLQEEPSTPPINEPSRYTDEATDPDEFTQVNAHHTDRSQCNHEFTSLDVVVTLERDLPTTLQDQWKHSRHKLMTSQFPFMTLVDYQFCSYPRHKSPCKEYMCPSHPHLHSTLDQTYQLYLTTSLLDTYFFASLMHMEKHHCYDFTKYFWLLDKLSQSKFSVKMTHMTTQCFHILQNKITMFLILIMYI